MTLKNNEFTIVFAKFGKTIGWISEYRGKDYGSYITSNDELKWGADESDKELYKILLDKALPLLFTIKYEGEDAKKYQSEYDSLKSEFNELLENKLK